jgi:membrane fusion protein (multidrug efflux system)
MPLTRLALVAGLTLAACLAGVPARAQMGPGGPPTVGVVTVQARPITESMEFTGRVQATKRVDVVARVTAFIQARLFEEGGEVAEGELLYRLDPSTFEAEVAARQAAVAQFTALMNNAALTLSRARALIGSGAGRVSSVDEAAAQQASFAAQLQAAQAQLKGAEISLGYTSIHAPIAGKVGRSALSVGNVVSPTAGPLVTIVSQDPMYVAFPVPVRTVLDLRARYAERGGLTALRVRVRLPDGRMHGPTGTLDYADPTVSPNTDSLTMRATIANPLPPGARPGEPVNRDLLDGAFVTVFLEGAEPVQALAVPRVAVLSDQQGTYVYVVDAEKKVAQRRVTLGQSPPGIAVILAGLQAGETVVADGLQRVRPGATVNPVPFGAPPPGPGGPAAGTTPANRG